MSTPIRNSMTQHTPSMMTDNPTGGAVRVGISVASVLSKEEVGITVGVDCCANGAPETGTIVGIWVGVGCAVGCVETDLGCAPIACLQASSSPSMLNPYIWIRASSI